jgi:hypothetical protein
MHVGPPLLACCVRFVHQLGIISQGIAARVQRGQASSAVAKEMGSRTTFGLLGDLALMKKRALPKGTEVGKMDGVKAKL